VARSVYNVKLDGEQIEGDFEYYLRVVQADQACYYPQTAPEIAHVVIVTK
jgi:hypothetical protein